MASPSPSCVFQRIPNFRDVAVSAADNSGQPVLVRGLLFRSAAPDDATQEDWAKLSFGLRLKTIIDLRSDTEHREVRRQNAAKVPPAPDPAKPDVHGDGHIEHGRQLQPLRVPGVNYKLINFNGSKYSSALIWQLSYFNIAKLFTWYTLGYQTDAISILGENVMAKRGLVGLAQDSLIYCGAEIKAVFNVLSDEANYPLLVHCTQGKDRTGLVVLLTLLLLGVDRDSITHDYLLSEQGLAADRPERVKLIKTIGLSEEFAGCPTEWVDEISRCISDQHGGIEKYLTTCGVTAEQMANVQHILRG